MSVEADAAVTMEVTTLVATEPSVFVVTRSEVMVDEPAMLALLACEEEVCDVVEVVVPGEVVALEALLVEEVCC